MRSGEGCCGVEVGEGGGRRELVDEREVAERGMMHKMHKMYSSESDWDMSNAQRRVGLLCVPVLSFGVFRGSKDFLHLVPFGRY